MTRAEFGSFTLRYSNLWRVDFTDGQHIDWHRVLGELKLHRLLATLDELSIDTDRKHEYPPRIAEVVERYEEIKIREAHIERKRQIAANQRYLTDANQHICDICRNAGIVSVYVDAYRTRRAIGYSKETPYSCIVRCSCGRGKDLNRWSRANISKDYMPTNPKTSEEESLYVLDVDDVFTPEEVGLVKAKNMSKRSDITERTDIGAVVNTMVGRMTA